MATGNHSAPRIKFLHCRHCGEEFIHEKEHGERGLWPATCSLECRKELRRIRSRGAIRRPSTDKCVVAGCPSPRVAKGFCTRHYQANRTHGHPLAVERNRRLAVLSAKLSYQGSLIKRCPECEEWFRADYAGRMYCTKKCSKRAGWHISTKRRKLATSVSRICPTTVFRRDGWRCQMCGSKTPDHLRGKHKPRSPEVDHIVPLALGGEHSYANVQCLCRQCNGKKGARSHGQLNLLFA